jgi:hypothetical protein
MSLMEITKFLLPVNEFSLRHKYTTLLSTKRNSFPWKIPLS